MSFSCTYLLPTAKHLESKKWKNKSFPNILILQIAIISDGYTRKCSQKIFRVQEHTLVSCNHNKRSSLTAYSIEGRSFVEDSMYFLWAEILRTLNFLALPFVVSSRGRPPDNMYLPSRVAPCDPSLCAVIPCGPLFYANRLRRDAKENRQREMGRFKSRFVETVKR